VVSFINNKLERKYKHNLIYVLITTIYSVFMGCICLSLEQGTAENYAKSEVVIGVGNE